MNKKPFEQIFEANIANHASRYESLAEIFIRDSLVVWECDGVLAKIEFLEGRILGSVKPSTYSDFSEPLNSSPFLTSDDDAKSGVTDLIAWLETQIATQY